MAELFPEPEEREAARQLGPDRRAMQRRASRRRDHARSSRVTHPGEPPKYDGGDLTEWFKRYCAGFELSRSIPRMARA